MNVTPLEFRRLWDEFDAPSWAPWSSVEDALFGLDRTTTSNSDRARDKVGRTHLPGRRDASPERAVLEGDLRELVVDVG